MYSAEMAGQPFPQRSIESRNMTIKLRGVMQSPVTPLKANFSLDLPTFERLLDFHVRSGSPAIPGRTTRGSHST